MSTESSYARNWSSCNGERKVKSSLRLVAITNGLIENEAGCPCSGRKRRTARALLAMGTTRASLSRHGAQVNIDQLIIALRYVATLRTLQPVQPGLARVASVEAWRRA